MLTEDYGGEGTKDVSEKMTEDSIHGSWQKAAKSRLHFELAGLAFACQRGFRPEDYARYLWSRGAVSWMGKASPGADEYLLKEAQAFREFWPRVSFTIVEADEGKAELVFTDGCLGGWGVDRWALAKSLGLTKDEVCAYCRESFSVWAEQLGLRASIGPDGDGTCRFLISNDCGE